MIAFKHAEKFRCSACWNDFDTEEEANHCCTGYLANVPIRGCCPKCERPVKVVKEDKYTNYVCLCGWSGRSS